MAESHELACRRLAWFLKHALGRDVDELQYQVCHRMIGGDTPTQAILRGIEGVLGKRKFEHERKEYYADARNYETWASDFRTYPAERDGGQTDAVVPQGTSPGEECDSGTY